MRYWNRILALLLVVLFTVPMISCTRGTARFHQRKGVSNQVEVADDPPINSAPEPENGASPITFGLSTGIENMSKSYINPYFGLRLDLDQNWLISSTREIDATNGFSTLVPQEERKKQYFDILATGAAINDFHAELISGLGIINFDVAYMSKEDQADEGMAFVNRYVNASREVFQKNGLQLNEDFLSNATVAQRSWPCWVYTSEVGGTKSNSVCVFFQKNDYVLILHAGSLGEDFNPQILALIAPQE
jgi:hypothetical protein